MKAYGRLEGRIAVITGAASGIGRATAELFAREGARLALADLNEPELKAAAAEAAASGGVKALYRPTDVASEPQVKALIQEAVATFGRVDILVNNAGIAGFTPHFVDEDEEAWLKTYRVNVLGAVHAIRHVVGHMIKRGSGAIVNTASVAGIRSGAGTNAYSASKAALINLTQTTACEFGRHNIRVNAVCPGLIETGMTRPVFDHAREKGKEEKLGSRAELLRYGLPMDVAHAILFLASDEAGFITGQSLPVDGGNTASLNMPGMKY